MVKSLDLFFESYKCFICESFSFGSNLFQSCPYVCSASCFKVPIDHLLILITLSLEKEIIVLEKVWKKSWILDPKICTNPECSSNDPVFLREWTVFYLKLTVPWHEQSSLEIKVPFLTVLLFAVNMVLNLPSVYFFVKKFFRRVWQLKPL